MEGNLVKPVCSKKQAFRASLSYLSGCPDFSLEEKLREWGLLLLRGTVPRADRAAAVGHGVETAGGTLA